MKTIFDFSDYRNFLRDHHQAKKQASGSWSYGLWAQKLGLKDNSLLVRIINGKREAGPLLTQKFIDYFKFDAKESQYFQELIKIAKFGNHPEVGPLLRLKLQKQNPRLGFSLIDEQEFSLISHWLYYALRQLCKLPQFRPDPLWIEKELQFKATPKQIQKALDLLIAKNLIVENKEQGRWEVGPRAIRTEYDFASEAIKQFHEGSLDNAKKAVREVPVDHREYLSLTMAFPREEMMNAKKALRDFVEEFNQRFIDRKMDSVYQLQINFYPLSKIKKEKK